MMLYTKEQVISGIISYIDSEIIVKLPTAGKVFAGAAVALASKNADTALNNAIGTYGKMLGVVNGDGLIDIDELAEALRTSAERYGKIAIDVPMLGKFTFTSEDIDIIRRYIQ